MHKCSHATSFKKHQLSLVALAIMVSGSVFIDQLTKHLAHKHLLVWEDNKQSLMHYIGQQYPVLTIGEPQHTTTSPKFFISFSGNYVRNQGAAWGLFSNWDDSIRIPFFYLVTILALCVIFFYWRTTPAYHKLARYALALIFSGAIGNFIDRFRLGYVIDFIDIRWSIPLPLNLNFSINFFPKTLDFLNISINLNHWKYDYPNFNWADSAITVGVFLLIIDMIFLEPKRMRSKPSLNNKG